MSALFMNHENLKFKKQVEGRHKQLILIERKKSKVF